MTTFSADSDENFIWMTTFLFQCSGRSESMLVDNYRPNMSGPPLLYVNEAVDFLMWPRIKLHPAYTHQSTLELLINWIRSLLNGRSLCLIYLIRSQWWGLISSPHIKQGPLRTMKAGDPASGGQWAIPTVSYPPRGWMIGNHGIWHANLWPYRRQKWQLKDLVNLAWLCVTRANLWLLIEVATKFKLLN